MTTSGESPEHLDGSDCVNHILEECSKAGDAELSWACYVINYSISQKNKKLKKVQKIHCEVRPVNNQGSILLTPKSLNTSKIQSMKVQKCKS